MIYTDISSLLESFTPNSTHFKQDERYLCIDYGLSKSGIAISTKSNSLAVPINTYSSSELLNKLSIEINSKSITLFVLGYPFDWEEESDFPKKIISFAFELLKKYPKIPIILYDETRSSVIVRNELHSVYGRMNKRQLKKYDKYVASLILQNFLDELNSKLL